MKTSLNCASDFNSNSREVQLRIIFLRIGEIDTLNEKFFAEILVEAKWEESKLCAEFEQMPASHCVQVANISTFLREEKELTHPTKYWNPKIYIENALNDPNMTIHYKIKKELAEQSVGLHKINERPDAEKRSKNEASDFQEFNNLQFKYWIFEYRKVKGFFFEKLELKYFPVDIQNMSVVITSYRSNKEVRLVHNKKRQSIVNNKVNIDKNIW